MAGAYDFFVCADESGVHQSPDYCLIAGYVGRPKPWRRFESRWMRVLRQHDVRDFHAKDYFAFDPKGRRVGSYMRLSDGQKASYDDWNIEKHKSFFDNGLLKVLRQGDVHPVGVAIETRLWNTLSYGERKYITGGFISKEDTKWVTTGAPSKPYFLLFQVFLYSVLEKTGADKSVFFVFDQQDTYKQRALELFSEIKQLAPSDKEDCLAGITFQSRQNVLGLQASDLYANCWFRYFSQPNNMGEERARAMDSLTVRDSTFKSLNETFIQGMFANLPEDVLDKIRNEKKPTDQD